jgi:alanyl-tRNA synthetase
MNTAEIHQRFTSFYEDMGYWRLPRAPLLDPSIPMSFVMSAGLVQVETSLAKSQHRDGNQFVLVQECFRHFDLDKVGTDDLHLSLFEMPGAFVFGPNGRSGTVQNMWKLATSALGIEKDRLWVSYFKGGRVLENNLSEDLGTRQAWLDVGIPESRIVGLGPNNNYWVQGRGIKDSETARKCGPNTELFFDRGQEMACSHNCLPGCKCGRFIEFSNSLFICSRIGEHNDSIQTLEDPFTETVIGSERVAMIWQNTNSVFETEEYRPLLETIHSFVNEKNLQAPLITTHERIIADHMKALYFLIADGAPPPGKDGRARIIKILIRRAITQQNVLGIYSDQFFPQITDCISKMVPKNMQETWIKEKVIAYIVSEYNRFSKTIKRGELKLLQIIRENCGNTLSGNQILILEKQWGMPPLITAMLLRKQGLPFHEEEYSSALNATNQTNQAELIGGR